VTSSTGCYEDRPDPVIVACGKTRPDPLLPRMVTGAAKGRSQT
jgi:hypothetical protein